MAREPAPRSPRPPAGSSRPTSARQTGSSAAAAAWTAGVRSQSATGASASRPDVPKHWLLATTAPCSRASAAISATRRVFPTPAPPRTSARPGRPAAAARHASWSTAELARPADELRRGPPGASRRRARPSGRSGRRAARVGHQALECLPRRRVRDHAELALQHRGAVVVGADRPGPVAQVGLQQHQGAVADLLQRLQLDPAARRLRRPGQVARPRPRRAEQVAQVRALPVELRPGLEQPVVVLAGQQVALVLGQGRGRRGRGPPRHRRPPPPPAPPAARRRRRAGRRGRSRCRASTDPGTSRPARARRPAPGAGDAARGAGWSAPARRSTPARTARRSAAGAAATRRGRPGTRRGRRSATSASDGPPRRR